MEQPGPGDCSRRDVVIGSALALLPGRAAASTGPARPLPAAALEARARAAMAERGVPGLAAALIPWGETPLRLTLGTANVEWSVPVGPDTVFQIGSVGKMFAGALALLLARDGRLDLDAPVTRWLGNLGPRWGRVTPLHLLTHTAGLVDDRFDTLDFTRDMPDRAFLRLLLDMEPEVAPGVRFRYSNVGYSVLGFILSEAGGAYFGEQMRERIFLPLGMGSTRVIDEAEIVPRRAGGYVAVEGRLRNQGWVAPVYNRTADGPLYSTLDDMIVWDAALTSGALLRPAELQRFLGPTRIDGRLFDYGCGWFSSGSFAARPIRHHSGFWQGFKTAYLRYPADRLSVLLLANHASLDADQTAWTLATILDPTLPEPRDID